MTHLVKFYELPNHIALLLEYHEHGRLIDFLSDYIVHRTREYKQRSLLSEVLGALVRGLEICSSQEILRFSLRSLTRVCTRTFT